MPKQPLLEYRTPNKNQSWVSRFDLAEAFTWLLLTLFLIACISVNLLR